MIGGELFEIAEQLDEQLLFDHPKVAEQISGHAVASGSPDDVPSVLRQVIQPDTHLAPVHEFERQVVDVGQVLLQEREHVMVGVHVQPHALGADPVRHLETQHLRIHPPAAHIAREEVDVAELSRVPPGDAAE